MSDRNAVLDEAIDAVKGVEPSDTSEMIRWNRGDWEATLARAIERIEALKIRDNA